MGKVLVRLMGGLGNQLFQIAAGSVIASRSGRSLSFDESNFSVDSYGRESILSVLFPDFIAPHEASSKDFVIYEREIGTDKALDYILQECQNKPDKTVILDGYWQSLDFVTSFFVIDLRERLVRNLDQKTIALGEDLKNESKSVALHFRRTDYFHHGIVEDSYYAAITRKLSESVGVLNIYAFADESNSTSYSLGKLPGNKFFLRSSSPLIDLFLFSCCNYHVMANSTFSWWGTTLSSTKGAFFPSPWSKIHKPSPRLFLNTWIPVESLIRTSCDPLLHIDLNI